MSFVAVMSLDDLWIGEMISVVVNEIHVLLIRQENQLYAYEDKCAHLGVPLSRGRLDREVLTCSAHEYQYDATTGKGINPRDVCLRKFAVRIVGQEIYVDVEGGGENSATS